MRGAAASQRRARPPRGSRGRTRSRARRRRPGRPAGRRARPRMRSPSASVSPPSTASPLRLPWQVNGSAPSASACAAACTVGSPGTPRLARADRRPARRAPRAARARRGSASDGDEDAERAARRRPRRRPRRAPRCRSSRSRGRAAPSGRRGRGARRPRGRARTPKRWRALCEPETLPVSSFTQTPPVRREAEPVAELVAARERRGREAVAVDGRDALVERCGRARRTRRRPCRPPTRDVVRVEQPAVADERVRLARRRREAHARRGRARGAGRGRRRRRGPRSGSGTDTGRRAAGSAPQPAQTSRLTCGGRSQRLQHAACAR